MDAALVGNTTARRANTKGIISFSKPGGLETRPADAYDGKGAGRAARFADLRGPRMTYHLAFGSPWYLLLFPVLLPLVLWLSWRTLAGLGWWRWAAAVALRSAVLALLVAALAEVELVRRSDRMTVIYVVDQSLSLPEAQRRQMVDYVNRAIREHRRREDRAGVIVFGRDASIEIAPLDEHVPFDAIESVLDPEYTNLAGAMKLAQASFPHDTSRRIVIVSDGKENLGHALEQARGLVESGIGIDVVPVVYGNRGDVMVEKLTAPADIRQGQPFDLRVVLENTAPADAADPQSGVVRGRVVIYQKTSDQPRPIAEQPVTLEPGKRVLTVRQQLDEASFFSYEARFIPDDDQLDRDTTAQNNSATAFTNVRGKGSVLLIRPQELPGDDPEERDDPRAYEQLAERLRQENIQVTLRDSGQPFTDLAELQQFDSVILANVPKEDFSDEQISMLVRNTEQLGAGLVMLGGPKSFGAGGWTNTELEAAMPVNFQIKNAKVMPKGALALVIDSSGSMSGLKIAMARSAAIAAARRLNQHDYYGAVAFTTEARWIVPMQPVGNARAASLISRLAAGGGTDMTPGMSEGYRALRRTDAAVKHLVVLTDGLTQGSGFEAMAAQMKRAGITTTTVAVGGDADTNLLEAIAKSGDGKHYRVNNPRALPRIFQREARRVSRPVVFERAEGFAPQVKYPHEILAGLSDELPPITGYVQTEVKDSPLVEVAVVSPVPSGEKYSTILATWNYGLGRSVAFTTDAAGRWTKDWVNWDGYSKLFSQIVRWSMRPMGDQGKFAVSTEVKDGMLRIYVTALDKNDEFLNFLSFAGTAIGPDLQPRTIPIEQKAPGRYVGEIPADSPGSYFLMLNPGVGMTTLRTGVNVGYSEEFRDLAPNVELLETLAGLRPLGGQPGRVIGGREPTPVETLLQTTSFRHDLAPATTSQDSWHLVLLIGSCLFFFDVLVRRVSLNLTWIPPLAARGWARLRGTDSTAAQPEYMERLRSRKAEVAGTIEQRKAAARFEPEPGAAGPSLETLRQELEGDAPASRKPASPAKPELTPEKPSDEESYTSRLLKAKRQVWDRGG